MEQTKVYLVYKTERLSEVKEMSSLKFGRGVEVSRVLCEESRVFSRGSTFFQVIFIFHTH